MSEPQSPSRPRRFFRRLLTLSATLATVALAAFAILIGNDALQDRANAAPAPDAAELTPVRVRQIAPETGYSVARRFTGQIEARQTVDLSFELPGRLVEILVDEGDVLRAGQVVARLDTDLLEAEKSRLAANRTAILAQLDFAEQTLIRNEALVTDGVAAQSRLDQARANRDELAAQIAQVDAALRATEIEISKSVLKAPFDGRVGTRQVDPGQTLGTGQTLISVIETAEMQFRVGLPLSFGTDALAQAVIEIAGEQLEARLVNLRPDIDAVTRTRIAVFSVDAPDIAAIGQTATLVASKRIDAPGFWVPLRHLKEAPGGTWSVLVLGEDATAQLALAEILHATSDRAYIRTTFPDGTQLIDAGPHRVTAGQPVQIVEGN